MTLLMMGGELFDRTVQNVVLSVTGILRQR